MADERIVAANRIAICFYNKIETAIVQGLTNADEIFNEREKEGQVSNEEVAIIIKKVHAAIITSLKKQNIAELPEVVNAHMQSYRRTKINGLQSFQLDTKDAIQTIDHHYRTHAEIVITMIFEKYQGVIQDALEQQLNALGEKDEEISKMMIIDFIQKVKNNCRNVQLDHFYLSEQVIQAYLTKNKGDNRIVVKRENSEDGQIKMKRQMKRQIEIVSLLSEDEEGVEEVSGQNDRISLPRQDPEQHYDSPGPEFNASRSSTMVQSSNVSVLFPQPSPSSSRSDSPVYYELINGEEDLSLPLDHPNNLVNGKKRSNANESSSEEESGEDSGQDEIKQSISSVKPVKKKVRSNDLTEADREQALKEEEEREQDFKTIVQNLESLPPATPTAEKKKIDEILHAGIDVLLQHFQAKRQKLLPPEIRCLLKHCKQNKEEFQKVLRAGMLPRAQELLLSIVNGKKEMQFEDFESLHSDKGKKYTGIKMLLFNHPFKQGLGIESDDYTATIDAIFITHSKAKCGQSEGHLRNYIKTPHGKNGITGKYLRTKAGYDFKDDFFFNESNQADEFSDKDKKRSTKEVDENPRLCIQLWTLYERMEKRVFFDMKSMQRDVSEKFNDDPEKFKAAICKFIKHVFMIICWSVQNDKELNEQIRQAFPLSQPPMGLNYELGYSGSNPSCFKTKEQKSFKGKAGKSSLSRPKDTRTKEEREWDAEQRRQANLKKYETMFAELLGEGTEAKLYTSQFSTSINVYLSKDKRIHFTPSREWFEENDIMGDDTIQLRLHLGEELYYIYDPNDDDEDDEDYGVGAELIVRKKLQDGTWNEYPYYLTSRQGSCAETIKKIIQEQKVKDEPNVSNN